MATPNQIRVAVLALVEEFGVSQRRSCSVVSQYRSTQRRCLVHSSAELCLREQIRVLAVKYPGLSSFLCEVVRFLVVVEVDATGERDRERI